MISCVSKPPLPCCPLLVLLSLCLCCLILPRLSASESPQQIHVKNHTSAHYRCRTQAGTGSSITPAAGSHHSSCPMHNTSSSSSASDPTGANQQSDMEPNVQSNHQPQSYFCPGMPIPCSSAIAAATATAAGAALATQPESTTSSSCCEPQQKQQQTVLPPSSSSDSGDASSSGSSGAYELECSSEAGSDAGSEASGAFLEVREPGMTEVSRHNGCFWVEGQRQLHMIHSLSPPPPLTLLPPLLLALPLPPRLLWQQCMHHVFPVLTYTTVVRQRCRQ